MVEFLGKKKKQKEGKRSFWKNVLIDLLLYITCDSNLLLSVKPSNRILSNASEELL